MPPRTKAATGLTSLIESDSEPDFDSLDTVGITATRIASKAMAPAKQRGRPPTHANKITKPAQRGVKRTSSGATRQALSEKNNNAIRSSKSIAKSGLDVASDNDDLNYAKDENALPPKRGRPKGSGSGGMKTSNQGNDAPRAAGRGRPPKVTSGVVEELPETQQPETMEVDEVEEEEDLRSVLVSEDNARESVSEDDQDDISLRRRLGELTKRYESLEARHKDLRDVGVKEAERNYERLKKQSEENTAGKMVPPMIINSIR